MSNDTPPPDRPQVTRPPAFSPSDMSPTGMSTVGMANSGMATAGMSISGVPTSMDLVPYLVLLGGWQPGLKIRLTRQPLLLGRAPECDVCIPDTQVSGRHCEVALAPLDSGVVVRDLRSTNGTYVDRRKVDGTAILPPGSLLRLGRQLFRHERLLPEEMAQEVQQEQDVEKARRYVQSLLPGPIKAGPVRTDWCFVPSPLLGGEAFAHQWLDDGRYAVYRVDVSTQGVASALLAVSVLKMLQQRALPGTDFAEPSQVLRGLNDMFRKEAHGGATFTFWYGLYDPSTRRLRYASAGQPPAVLVSADRTRLKPLHTGNPAIGVMPGFGFRSEQVDVAANSSLYMFGTGVYKVADAAGAQLGLPGFLPLLQQSAAAQGAEAQRVYQAVRAHAGPGALDDDFTLLVVTFP